MCRSFSANRCGYRVFPRLDSSIPFPDTQILLWPSARQTSLFRLIGEPLRSVLERDDCPAIHPFPAITTLIV
jgi:hypothetical protein